jgi:hypothetical protein
MATALGTGAGSADRTWPNAFMAAILKMTATPILRQSFFTPYLQLKNEKLPMPDNFHVENLNTEILILRFAGSAGVPANAAYFLLGSVEHALQARRKQIPALKARNSKARGETPGLEGSGTSPPKELQSLMLGQLGFQKHDSP